MGSFEGDIGNAAFERLQEAPVEGKRALVGRIEDFAIDNMTSIAAGVSAAILVLASLIFMQDRTDLPVPIAKPDHLIVGSIDTQSKPSQDVQWQVLRKPSEIIALQSPQFERASAQYAARRSNRDEREDSLSWQTSVQGGAEASIALVRRPVPLAAPSLFVEMTRLQSERGVAIARAGMPGLFTTKFGQLEVADMTFSDAGGTSQACLAFRSVGEGAAPGLRGWYCAAQGSVVERPELACFIDRLALLKSGEDQALRRFFTEAEQRRQPCANARNTAGRKPTWLDQDGRVPSMRGADETTGSIAKPKR